MAVAFIDDKLIESEYWELFNKKVKEVKLIDRGIRLVYFDLEGYEYDEPVFIRVAKTGRYYLIFKKDFKIK